MPRAGGREEPASLLERLAIGLACGLVGLALGTLLWLVICAQALAAVPFSYVQYFAAGVAVLGFALCDGLLARIVGAIFEVLSGISRW
jgi:hypothetical protein